MSKRDYYEVLGVNKDATESELKKAYRTQSKKFHPDVNPEGEDQFKEVAEAYETLSNKEKKQSYDTYGHGGPQPQRGSNSGFNMEDIFNQFDFGGQRQRQRKGQDLVLNVKITLEEVFNGVTKKFRYNRTANCKTCDGVGGKKEKTCDLCQGHGYIFHQQETPMGTMRQMVNCSNCGATGKIVEEPCTTCDSRGVANKEEIVEVQIPNGIREGDTLQYLGMGHAIKSGPAGSLLIRILIQNHKDFIRDGSDLRHQLKLSYSELVLGEKIQVPTIDGKEILITVPPRSKPGDILRIIHKGIQIKGTTTRGDMMVILDIEMPVKVSDEEKELLEKLKKISSEVETSENK